MVVLVINTNAAIINTIGMAEWRAQHQVLSGTI